VFTDAPGQPLGQNIDEKLFRLLVASVKDYAIFLIDQNGHILSWNQGAEYIKGYKESEIVGQHISVFYTPEDVQVNMPRSNLNAALRNEIHESEGWRVRKDGSVFWANVVFTTLYNDDGHLIGFAKVTRDITGRKNADDKKAAINAELEKRVKANTAKIIANELRFRKLIENSYDGITLLDKKLNVFYRSISSERISGWNNSESLKHKVTDLTHPDDQAAIKEMFTEVLANPNTPMLLTFRTRHKTGHYTWVECLFTNMLYDEAVNAIVCNFKDVTERKIAEEEIKRKTEQVENILESITDGFIALDNDFCYTYANKRIGVMLGRDPASLIGKYIWEQFPDIVESETHKAFLKAFAQQQYICNEDYYAPLNLWQENHIYPTAGGLSVFIRDISERKRAELEILLLNETFDITDRKLAEVSLIQSETNLRSVFENTDLAIILFDNSLKIVSFNQNAQEFAINNYHRKLKIGNSASKYFPKEKKLIIDQINKCAIDQEIVTYETLFDLADGTKEWYDIRWVGVTNKKKEHAGIIMTLENITEKKIAEMERDKMTADLTQRNKDLEQFTYIVSHNLRAPVANILGLSDILLESENVGKEIQDALKALSLLANSLDRVILDLNHILQVSSQVNAKIERVSLSSLVEEISAGISHMIHKDKV
jgi:PAS domain S-box-containing protein